MSGGAHKSPSWLRRATVAMCPKCRCPVRRRGISPCSTRSKATRSPLHGRAASQICAERSVPSPFACGDDLRRPHRSDGKTYFSVCVVCMCAETMRLVAVNLHLSASAPLGSAAIASSMGNGSSRMNGAEVTMYECIPALAPAAADGRQLKWLWNTRVSPGGGVGL